MLTTFAWFDYFLFIFMLLLSAIIGAYYGIIHKQKTADDYLLGNKQMSVWPIAMSLVSSSLSGMILLSFPADVYRYGITFCITVPMIILVMLAAYYVFIPVFYKLEITSVFEYLKERFDTKVRMFASLLYTIHQILFIPIIIYVPALALSQATGLNTHYITPLVCSVCIFYTTLGGMKAIVKTDSIQFGIMLGTLFVAVIIGIWLSGGFRSIFETAYRGKRLDISFDLTLFKRDTFWSALALFFTMVNHFAINQSFVQKCLSLPSYNSVKRALILTTLGIILIQTFSLFSGLIILTKYINCDPLENKFIKNYDQLMPMYIMENINFIPGFAGLFLSGIFSASLSTLAASMNGLAATLYKDFISAFVSKNTSQERVSLYLKLLVVLIGVLSTICVFIIEKLGSLLALTLSLSGITGGPLLGLFCVGTLIPTINSKTIKKSEVIDTIHQLLKLSKGEKELNVALKLNTESIQIVEFYLSNPPDVALKRKLETEVSLLRSISAKIKEKLRKITVGSGIGDGETSDNENVRWEDGALWGGIASLVIMTWIIMTAQWYKFTNALTYPILPVSIDGCNVTVGNTANETTTNITSNILIANVKQVKLFFLFRISFYFYGLMGAFIVVAVSAVVSCFTKENKPLNENCICPLMQFLIKKGKKKLSSKYNTVDKALELVNKN